MKDADQLDAEQAKIFREASELAEREMNALLTNLRKSLEETGQSNETNFITLQKEFADKIESSNRSTQRVIEVIDFLSQPRTIEFLPVVDIDARRALSPVSPVQATPASTPSASRSASASRKSLFIPPSATVSQPPLSVPPSGTVSRPSLSVPPSGNHNALLRNSPSAASIRSRTVGQSSNHSAKRGSFFGGIFSGKKDANKRPPGQSKG